MKRLCKQLVIFGLLTLNSCPIHAEPSEEWITILIHGIIGFGANFCSRTIYLAKNDQIEGSKYERQVTSIREHPYLGTIQPTGPLGLHPVVKPTNVVNAAYAFSALYTDLANRYGSKENNTFYTYGWSGLLSAKRRHTEARQFYLDLKNFIEQRAAQGSVPKIRLIGYSHGATMVLNFAKLRATEFSQDSFLIDETYLLGTPMNTVVGELLALPPFKKVYNIYSKSDKVQRLDIFSGGKPFSQWSLLGCTPKNLTQIEIQITAPLRRLCNKTLPSNMRGTIDQSPGHIELWSFGWTRSLYRSNLSWYPMAGGIFIPYLIYAAQCLENDHVKVDIRLEDEISIVTAKCGSSACSVPFMTETQFTSLVNKALAFHPSNTKYIGEFLKLQESVGIDAYK